MRARNAGIYKTPLADAQSYAKRTQSMVVADEWLKVNKAKQCTTEDNTGIAYRFNGRLKRGVKK